MFFVDRHLVPSISENLSNATWFLLSFDGIINGIPFVVYAYMYQPNIPMVYRELNDKNYKRMEKVTARGAGAVVVLYLFAAIFGYLGLVSFPEGMQRLIQSNNVLEVEYGNWAFNVAIIGLLFATFAGSPV